MAKHNDFGQQGEAAAQRYLVEQGYKILDTNWRMGHLEADIIALKDEVIAFVEVKTRSGETFGEPETFVDLKKQRAYIRLANNYVLQKNRYEEARFDIISVVINETGLKLNHIPRAFTTIG